MLLSPASVESIHACRRLGSDTSRTHQLGMILGGTLLCVPTPYVSRRYDPQYMVRCIEVLDHTVRALTVQLYTTRARHYDTLERMRPVGTTVVLPSFIPYPRRTEMPTGLVWPEVGGDTPARGPPLPPGDQLVHESRHGMQPPSLEHRQAFLHRQLPDLRGFLRR